MNESFGEQKFLSSMKSTFSFMAIVFCPKELLSIESNSYSPVFSSENITVLAFTFRSISN